MVSLWIAKTCQGNKTISRLSQMDSVLRTVAPLHAKKHEVQMSNLKSNGTFGFTITNE